MFSLFNEVLKELFRTIFCHRMLEFGAITHVLKVGIEYKGYTVIELILNG